MVWAIIRGSVYRKTSMLLRSRSPAIPRALLYALALVACLAVPAHAQLPTLGDGSDMAAGAERRLGDRIARELYRDPDYIDDPVLVEYVQQIWERLVAAAKARGEMTPELQERFAWEILLGRDRSVNAFALPGGYMGVNLGLIGVVTSEDELASVLAHEMSHVTQRHISRLMTQQSRQTPLLLASMVLGALAASKSPDAANALILGGQAVAAQNQLNFSRDMEREADRVGYGVMTQAGYSGQGFVSMFEKLQQASRINDNGSFPYLRSHPLTTQRIADMQQRHQLEAPTPASTAPDLAHAMVAARARVLANRAGDVERLWLAEPATAGFAAQEASRRAAALYAAALISLRQREFERARGFLARLHEVVQGHPAAQRQARLLAAELELAAGAPLRAQDILAGDPASAGWAGKLRRPELVLKTQAQLAQGPRGTVEGAGGSMADALQTWLATHPKDATVWQLLASVYRLEQQPLRAIRAEAEAQVALRDYAAAMDRFRAGQDLARHSTAAADHVEASIIDTRARDVQSILREQAAER